MIREKRKLGYIAMVLGISGLLLTSTHTVLADTVSENAQEQDRISENMTVEETDLDAEQAGILHSGKDGDLNWSIDANGLLTISGTGIMTMAHGQITVMI